MRKCLTPKWTTLMTSRLSCPDTGTRWSSATWSCQHWKLTWFLEIWKRYGSFMLTLSCLNLRAVISTHHWLPRLFWNTHNILQECTAGNGYNQEHCPLDATKVCKIYIKSQICLLIYPQTLPKTKKLSHLITYSVHLFILCFGLLKMKLPCHDCLFQLSKFKMNDF